MTSTGVSEFEHVRKTTMTNDNLVHHIDEVLAAFDEWPASQELMKERTAGMNITPARSREDYIAFAHEYNTIIEETVGVVYYRIDIHATAILKLSSNPLITEPMGIIADYMAKLIGDMRDVVSEVERVSSDMDKLVVLFKLAGFALRGLAGLRQLAAAIEDVKHYRSA